MRPSQEKSCRCGCGKPVPSTHKSGWLKGHWNRDGRAKWSQERRQKHLGANEKYSDDQIFRVYPKALTNRQRQNVRNYYTRRRKKLGTYKCDCCGMLPIWNGKPLTLSVDHKRGVGGKDSRFESLQLLCPNCHSQTENFSGRNSSHSKKRKWREVCEIIGDPRSKSTTSAEDGHIRITAVLEESV